LSRAARNFSGVETSGTLLPAFGRTGLQGGQDIGAAAAADRDHGAGLGRVVRRQGLQARLGGSRGKNGQCGAAGGARQQRQNQQ